MRYRSGTLLLGLVVCVSAVNAPAAGAPPTAEQLEKIRAAVPEKATVKPDKPRKLLVFTLCTGFRHSAIECGAAAFEAMGQKTGAYETIVSDDISMFEPESLRQFDAICFMNTTGELFLPKEVDKLPPEEQETARTRDQRLKKSLLDFVRGGKGIVGIHAATDCFYQWPDFGELMGGYFHGHPWHEKVTIKLDEPEHALNAVFGGKPLEIVDEIYQFRDPYSRAKLRVLLSLDTDKTDMNKQGIHRDDNDFAVSWVRDYGKGRVFYCSLGHREEIFWNPTVLRHYLDGTQFALGDLHAPATPLAPRPAAPSADAGRSEQSGWLPLFNGKDLTGWTCKPGAWAAEDGALARKGGSDVWTEEQFGDFVLELEFKLDPGANSGIFIRTADIKDCVQTGIEVQVLDSYGKSEAGKHDCGAIYDCLAPRKNVVRKAGEWNHAVITCKASRISVVMNGEEIIKMDLDEWTEPHKNPDGTKNKFRTPYKDMPRVGHIGLQDHGKPVWYRNIRVKRLGG